MIGADKCRMHVGRKSSEVKAAAAEARALARLLPAEDAIAPADPLEALSRMAGQAIAFMDAAGELVKHLEEYRYRGTGGEQLRAEVALYERAMDRSGRFLVDVARLRIDERLAAVSEAQARQLEAVLIGVLARYGIDGRDAEVRTVVGEVLDSLGPVRLEGSR